MTDEEIRKLINKFLDERLKSVTKIIKKQVGHLEDQYLNKINYLQNYYFNEIKIIHTLVKSNELSIQSMQIGLNNVHVEFSKLTDQEFLRDFNAKLIDFKRNFNQIKKDVDDFLSFMEKGYKKMEVINHLYQIRNLDINKIENIANIVKILKE